MLDIYKQRYNFKGNLCEALYFTGDWHDHETKTQPQFMIDHGLKPHHKFLDLACGCLRGTAPLVEYMDEGNYYGADISEGLLKQGYERVKELGINKKPNLILIDDYDFKNFPKFDYILSLSLLTHLLPETIYPLFKGVSKILLPNGIWYFTMYPSKKEFHEGNIEVSYFDKDWLIEKGKEANLIIEDIDEGIRKNDCPGTASWFCPVVNSSLGQWVMKARINEI